MTTHVCLVSDQPIPNLIPLRLEKPERVIFLVSEQKQQEALRLRRIIGPWGITIEERLIPPFDLNAVADVCAGLIQEFGKDQLTLNVTGGTKVSALAAFEAFYSGGCRVIYVNSATDELLTLSPAESKTSIPNLIGVRDYLASYGLLIQKGSGQPSAGFGQRVRQTKRLAELFVKDDDLLQTVNRLTQPLLNKDRQGRGYLHLKPGDFEGDGRQIFQLLRDAGIATPGINDGININRPEDIFFLGGGWLEEFVYATVRELAVHEVMINVKVEWAGTGKRLTTNEFDVLFTHRNRLHVVSCKAANMERESTEGSKGKAAIYELDALADKAGGLFGETMLVSARPLSDYDRARSERMRIKVIAGRDLPQLKSFLNKVVDCLPPTSAGKNEMSVTV